MTSQVTPADTAVPTPAPAPVVTRRFRLVRAIALIPSAVAGLAMIWGSSVVVDGRRLFALVDDSLISMTYARTFARTGELVWFPGADRVEGFTNPGYTFIMTVPHLLGLDQSRADLAMSLFGLATVLLTAFLTGGLAARVHATSLTAVVATGTAGLVFPLLYWSVFGLEVGLITALLLVLAVLALRGAAPGFPMRVLVALAVVSAAGILVRPDFAVGAAVVALWVVLAPTVPHGIGRLTRIIILGIGVFGSMAAITAARYLYYGAVTPNTYDLKMGDSALIQRLSRAFSMDTEALWLVGLGALAVVVLLLARRADRWGPVWLLSVLGLSQIGYAFYVGGDTFHPNRFLVPATVCVVALLIPAMTVLPRSGGKGAAAALLGAAVAAVVLWRTLPEGWAWLALIPPVVAVVAGASEDRWRRGVPALPATAAAIAVLAVTAGNNVAGYSGWWTDGAALWPMDRLAVPAAMAYEDFTAPDAVIAVYGAGAIPYWAERPAVDLLGKSDRVVAREARRGRFIPGHDKWDYTHSILGQMPDVIDGDLLNADDPVTQFVPPTAQERSQIARYYDRMCRSDGIAVLVRRDSQSVVRDQLVECPLPAAAP